MDTIGYDTCKEKSSYSALGSRKSWRDLREISSNVFKEKGYSSTLDSRKSWGDLRKIPWTIKNGTLGL